MNSSTDHNSSAVNHIPALDVLTPSLPAIEEVVPEASSDRLHALLDVSRFRNRFHALYAALALALVASAVATYGISFGHWFTPPAQWSAWRPPQGSVKTTASVIAHHISETYRLSTTGPELVKVRVQAPPAATIGNQAVSIPTLFIQPRQGHNTGIQTLDTSTTVMYSLCGRGPACSLAANRDNASLDSLVRREALELALMTMKYIPTANAVLTALPRPSNQPHSPILFFRKPALSKQLNADLATTLPLARPPQAANPDRAEATTIDRLTLPNLYRYQPIRLPLGGIALALNPIASHPH